jgi:glycerate dehydrogenase
MNVLAYDAYRIPALEDEHCKYVDLDILLQKADVISLHTPLTVQTQGMINSSSIATMKDGVIILNTSRGPLINEVDLAEALKSGKVFAAALDVVSSEPIKSDNPLLGLENCIITPHIAWAPKESRQRLMDIAVYNLKSFLQGTPVNVVNAS